MRLHELFTSGQGEWAWTERSQDEVWARFNVGDTTYKYHAWAPSMSKMPGLWDIEFLAVSDDDSDYDSIYGVTGAGNSAAVMSRVVDITRALIDSNPEITAIHFTALEPSRQKLYQRMALRLLPGWTMKRGRMRSGDGAFTLIKPTPQGEENPALATPDSAYQYALRVIHGPWPEAEPVILSNPWFAVLYAQNVLKGPWPAAEKRIAQDSELALRYAQDVIQGPWPLGEKSILSTPDSAYYYALNVIGDRDPKVEQALLNLPHSEEWAVYYAQEVIGGRWREAEPMIAQSADAAVKYAKNVIRGPWPQAERAISRDETAEWEYNNFLGRRNQ